MYKRFVDKESGICVEYDDNVPVGCELGGPKLWAYMSFKEKIRFFGDNWPISLLLMGVLIMIVIFISGIISIISQIL